MKRFKRICTGGPFGDETSSYDIILPEEDVTVEEFIEQILVDEPNEWGAFYCGRGIIAGYEHGEATFRPEYDKYKKYKIVSVTAHGGWSLMDYDIVVHKKIQQPDWANYNPQQLTIFDF